METRTSCVKLEYARGMQHCRGIYVYYHHTESPSGRVTHQLKMMPLLILSLSYPVPFEGWVGYAECARVLNEDRDPTNYVKFSDFLYTPTVNAYLMMRCTGYNTDVHPTLTQFTAWRRNV